VLHQDTGFQDWLETGEGIFAFSNVDDIVAALEKIDRDYRRHAKAARAAAEQNFEARTVIGRMLDDCRFR
jgi:glycosyltransferase involved in cell wall biosynthesis